MDTQMLIEIFGYIGSVLVVVSMLMSSVVKLRIINTVGSVISGTYALIIGSFPLALMNICLIIINVYNLFKLLKTEQKYDLVEGKVDETFLDYFLQRYKEDIKLYFPGFDGKKSSMDKVYFVCCEGNPAGILLGTEKEKGVLDIEIDYSVPTYRDCSVGTYLYSKLTSYMNKMGFTKENGVHVKKLA
ncbi:MAG: YgjV family protein [Lachnospiraceae bacterium]|nr:YgjV family protein [Lachnospiraceae bacterium]